VQDKDWEGYTDIPLWIMQGYGVMALECAESFKQSGIQPTHVFVQAGVGSMAAAVIGLMADFFAQARPRIVLMESEKADCYYQTAAANDGSFHVVGGEMDTIMAGLACGEPTNLGWPIIRDYVDCFVALPDFVTASGMRILAAPSGSDVRIVSGESAAVGVGLAYCLMTDPAFAKLRNRIDLGPDSIVLCFSTEGDTDKENYRRIVWEGAWPTVRTERKQTK
jgi:diaminopropionate ammonia-lyase